MKRLFILEKLSFQWFDSKVQVNDDEEIEDTIEVLKAKADHAYAKRNFDRAGDLYGQISIKLDYGKISMPLYRESCEGQVRCLIKNPSDNQEEAQNLAIQLVIIFLQNKQGIFLFFCVYLYMQICSCSCIYICIYISNRGFHIPENVSVFVCVFLLIN